MAEVPAQSRNGDTAQAEERFDAGAQLVAAVHAKAFLAAAASSGNGDPSAVDKLIAEFDSFMADVLGPQPEFEKVICSAMISSENKVAMLDRILASRASTLFLNFLKVVALHDRLDVLRSIHHEVHALHDIQRGRLRVHVTTAGPIDAKLTENILSKLKSMLPGEPVLKTSHDPSLIGGVVLRIGDTVFDGSVSRQLEQLREQMIDRSVHEIQSRRDRFRTTS